MQRNTQRAPGGGVHDASVGMWHVAFGVATAIQF
jgi:hypothetical protein